jgi:uncharacterized protein YbaP (TraB family)
VNDAQPNRLEPPLDGGRDHALGRARPDITLVEFGSYTCPYCHAAHAVIADLRDRFGERMRYVFRQRPTAGDPDALRAAELAEYAHATTGRFWERRGGFRRREACGVHCFGDRCGAGERAALEAGGGDGSRARAAPRRPAQRRRGRGRDARVESAREVCMRASASRTGRCGGVATRGALAVAVLAAALVTAPAAAGPFKKEFTSGLLWRIAKPGAKDSFAFGTIHLADARVNGIPKPVDDALAQSATLALELVPGVVADARVFELELLDDGRTLESLIGAAAFALVREQLGAHAIPEETIARLKPWAVLVKLGRTPSPDAGSSLDQRLLEAARARRMRVAPLELPDEQIAAFDAVPLDSQVALLRHALDHREALEATIEPTIAAWLRRDLLGLARISDRVGERYPGMGRHYGELTKHIVYNRTVLMHHRLVIPLRAGGVFVAVGALHLYGSRGLLAMLEQDGYRVTRIW